MIKKVALLMLAMCLSLPAFSATLPKTKADLKRGQECRSRSQAHKFEVQTGYPKGRKGWIVDHVCALANGGIDRPSNMQWQTKQESDAKDRIENTPAGKKIWCNKDNSTPKRQVFNCK